MSSHGEDIELSLANGVAEVRLNRPNKRNAVSLAMWRRLSEIFSGLAGNPEARAVILTGSGGHFCAGADISEFAEVRADVEAGRVYEHATEEATIAIRDWPGPTIAAISGYAMGGGCGLALACDIRVGDPTAKMGIPAARLGIIYSPLDCNLLYRQVGLANAKRVLYGGRPFGFDDCVRMGLLDIAAETDALAAARDLALSLAENAPLTLKGSKLILEACADGSAAARGTEIDAVIDAGIASADYAEGRQAFMEKRKPVFVGR
ncbi:enoyl-CoA hydratase-related protein [Enterovirga rhinocerotis]|uniref:Enoyl-CoA hydratase/carnithine racemase n=1 Tax=Enterovirga rhinocerotis TaxID=1339210 RepID=A0A4R7BTU5_9HYPH|nr:enoyl-CoA hydratase-related protein [Enterovirga rhinocerotis]TDR88921.1 enoyl-CoA hydratase/carnithine racemase [Enterovirga rhinocerotis]